MRGEGLVSSRRFLRALRDYGEDQRVELRAWPDGDRQRDPGQRRTSLPRHPPRVVRKPAGVCVRLQLGRRRRLGLRREQDHPRPYHLSLRARARARGGRRTTRTPRNSTGARISASETRPVSRATRIRTVRVLGCRRHIPDRRQRDVSVGHHHHFQLDPTPDGAAEVVGRYPHVVPTDLEQGRGGSSRQSDRCRSADIHVNVIPSVTTCGRDSRHRAVRDAATAQVAVTADQ